MFAKKMSGFLIPLMLLLTGLSSNETFAWQSVNQTAARKNNDMAYVVYRLKNRKASEVAKTLSNFQLEFQGIKFVEDQNSNSILVAYDMERARRFDSLKKFLEILDAAPLAPPKKQSVVSYQLGGMPDEFALNLVATLFNSRDVRAQYYKEKDSLIFYATPEQHKQFQMTLDLLSKELKTKKAENRDLTVVATMIIDGDQTSESAGKSHTAPNDRLTAIINKATQRGLVKMKTPLVVCQTVNRVSITESKNRFPFANTSSSLPTAKNRFQFRLTGNLAQANKNQVSLELDLQISNQKPEGTIKTEISSRVRTQLGKPVMLGLSKLDGLDTLVAIEVFTNED